MHWGYLLDQFAMTFMNHRTDEYGGALENRLRCAREILDGVKAACGSDFVVSMRLALKSYIKGYNHPSLHGEDEVGRTLEEGLEIAKRLEAYGYDCLSVDFGQYDSFYYAAPPCYMEKGRVLPLAKAAKEAVKIPILCGGRMNDPDLAAQAVAEGSIDGIVLGRPSLADPAYPQKVAMGCPEDIRPCIGCNQGCTGETAVGNRVNCIANPHTCRETEYDLSIVAEPKKVFVAGAGVAGLAAAYGAAERGHKVTVFEASDEIGGQWLSAMTPPGKSEYASLILNYRNQLKKYGAQIRLETPLTREIVEAEKPDAVILATGGTPMFLPIPGLDNREFVKTAIEVLRGRTLYGKRVVVAGGGMTGAETAVFLAVQGCDVTMIEMAPDIITDAVAQPRACLLEHIRKYNVKVHTHTKLTKVGEGTVYAEEYGEPITFKHIDMLVNAMGVRSYNPLQEQLEGLDCKVVVVGDASSTKNGYKNIREGFNAGNAI